jgi:hypothetical protein
MEPLPLVCHPATPCSYVSAVTARVDRLSSDLLVVYYQVEGDIDQLQLPPQRRSAHTDGLWQHTCFEAFVRETGARNYLELNFAPSSEWADLPLRRLSARHDARSSRRTRRRSSAAAARIAWKRTSTCTSPASCRAPSCSWRCLRARGPAGTDFVLGAGASAGQRRLSP